MPIVEDVFLRRKRRVRNQLKQNAKGKVRLSVFRSGKHIYAQLIDDVKSTTLASASTLDTELKGKVKSTASTEAAKQVGALIAKRALEQKVKNVVFDRGGYLYHGRVKAVAEGAREGGLVF